MPTGMNLINEQTRTLWSVPVTMSEPEQPSKRTVRIKRRYISDALKAQPTKSRFIFTQTVSPATRSAPCSRTRDPRAPPTYPFLAYATVKDRSRLWSRYNGLNGRLAQSSAPTPAQTKKPSSATPGRQEANPPPVAAGARCSPPGAHGQGLVRRFIC